MTPVSLQALILSAVRDVSTDRLQRAICGLADGTLTVTLTRHADTEIRALVKNGDGKEYGVTLIEALTTCSCKDALYRGGICKHGVAVALYVLRTTQPQKAALAPQFPMFHLMWRDGIVLCGAHHPERVQVWPWTGTLLTWPEVCPSCVTVYKQPKVSAIAA